MADDKGHIPNDLYDIYEELAKGGVGMIIIGFTSIYDDNHLFSGIVRLSNDKLIDEHKKLVNIVHKEDCKILVQLTLGQYKNLMIDDLSKNDILEIEDLFINAVKRAKEIWYDGIQIHAAHFFFISRFISPAHNHRLEEYNGGNGKILIDIIKNIRNEVADMHISIKINYDDFVLNGLTKEQSMKICEDLIRDDIDSIEVSGNGTSVTGIKAGVNESYFKDFAIKLTNFKNANVILVGGNRSKESMETILNESDIKCFSLSRPLIREQNLPNRWINGDISPSKCISCNHCYNIYN